MPKGKPLTPEEQAQRRQEVFDVVVNLIQQKGFHETSMREIAAAAGMGKSTLYDYFKTKDEILVFVLEEQTDQLVKKAQKIAAEELPPDARLKRIMAMHLDYMQANKNLHSRLTAEVQRMRFESQKRIMERRYAYQNLVAGTIEEGIRDGCFRQVNPLNAARLLINTMVSVLYTSRPTGSPAEMMDEAVDIFLNGIKK